MILEYVLKLYKMLLFCIVKHFRLSSIISFKNDISIEKFNECVIVRQYLGEF